MTAAPRTDIEALRQWIGRTAEDSDLVTPRLVQSLAATIGLEPVDAEAGATAPLGTHWCLAPAIAPQSAVGADGHPARGGFLPPVDLPRRMWASSDVSFLSEIRVGDVVARRSTIADVQRKHGRSGELCFVTIDHSFATARGIAVEERQTIVYRDAEQPGRLSEERPAATSQGPAAWLKPVAVTSLMLFRYSAVTFNGHRIHYDADYVRDVEGYPGLVVHGPLQATLLLHFAAEIRAGRPPAHFSFRGVRPAFLELGLSLRASDAGSGLSLWTETDAGQQAMTASAEW